MLQCTTHRPKTAVLVLTPILALAGCHSILNGWLSPAELGAFSRETTLEIRGSLSIQDTPRGIRGATEPTYADITPTAEMYRLVPGDAVNVFIFELRARNVEAAQQAMVNNRGMINLPVIGWFKAAGLTAQELEEKIRDILAERDIIHDAQVLVQFAAQRALTYTIFGNELLAVRLNRGPGVFPIPRPDFSLLDALSVAGGLSELVSEVYVFRKTERDRAQEIAITEMAETGDARPSESETPEIADEPPPLPGVAFTSGLDASGAALIGFSTQVGPEKEPPADKAGSRKPLVDPAKENPGAAPDVQEIIDLMLANPEQTGESEDEPPPAKPVAPVPPREEETVFPESGDVAPAGRWIFLNGEWIEVSPETAQATPPVVPPKDQEIAPAVDWDEIAEEREDIRLIRISPDGLRQGDPRYNIVVRPGDVIRLYSGDIGFYYLTGHVRRPGVYSFRSGATVTLKNAVAAAAGLDALGWPDRVTVYRRIADREQMIQVNLDRIYAGVEPDFYLKKDDIVNFGTHPFAPFLVQIRNLTMPQLGGSITYFYRYINQKQKTAFSTQNEAAQTLPGLFP